MIVLFTDFGLAGPYTGQVKAVLHGHAPGHPVIDLFADLPPGNPRAAGYLLAAYDDPFAAGSVFLCVVDPGVGSPRKALCLSAGGRWYVGPDNGIFEQVIRQSSDATTAPPEAHEILWRPDRLSATFHGRDLFAPMAAALAEGQLTPDDSRLGRLALDELERPDWPDDLAEVIYIDHYGNAMTGIRAHTLDAGQGVRVAGVVVARAETFSSVSPGEPFCYENANGLLEIAVNRGRADSALGVKIGTAVDIRKS